MKWIPTKDKLPKQNQEILTISKGEILKCLYRDKEFLSVYMGGFRISWSPTHWMPLPPSPKDVDNE